MREIIKNRVTMIKPEIKEIEVAPGTGWIELESFKNRIFVVEDFAKNLLVSQIVMDMYIDRCRRNNVEVDVEHAIYGKLGGVFGCVFGIHDLVFLMDENNNPIYWD